MLPGSISAHAGQPNKQRTPGVRSHGHFHVPWARHEALTCKLGHWSGRWENAQQGFHAHIQNQAQLGVGAEGSERVLRARQGRGNHKDKVVTPRKDRDRSGEYGEYGGGELKEP